MRKGTFWFLPRTKNMIEKQKWVQKLQFLWFSNRWNLKRNQCVQAITVKSNRNDGQRAEVKEWHGKINIMFLWSIFDTFFFFGKCIVRFIHEINLPNSNRWNVPNFVLCSSFICLCSICWPLSVVCIQIDHSHVFLVLNWKWTPFHWLSFEILQSEFKEYSLGARKKN